MDKKSIIEEKVFSYIKEYHMLSPKDRVVAGVSGGADSVCLLFVLSEWGKREELDLSVVHVNHLVRREAGEDALYVKQLCAELGIPFFLEEADVGARAALERISVEEAGRLARYEAFERVLDQTGADRIAVAHNCNDLAETMLFNLFRGTGITGLCGIRPVRGRIIRPLLCLEREETEEYLRLRGISFCHDCTNDGDHYTRNRIRHHILPYAREAVAGGCIAAMARTAGQLQETEEYLGGQVDKAAALCVTKQPCENGETEEAERTYVIDVERFLTLHPVIEKRLLFSLAKALSPSHRDIGAIHIQDLMTLFTRKGNRSVNLPYSICAKRSYGQVILERAGRHVDRNTDKKPNTEAAEASMDRDNRQAGDNCPVHADITKEMMSGGTVLIPQADKEWELRVFPCENSEYIPQNRYTKWFDYDKIKKSLSIRPRRTGDYLTIRSGPEGTGRKTVKDYMIDCKIPAKERDHIPLLAENDHVLWIIGYRISEYYKISENTKRILQVQLKRKSPHNEAKAELYRDSVGGRTEENDGGTHKSHVDGEAGG